MFTVTTYEVTPELAGLSTKRLVLRGIALGAIYILVGWLLARVWPTPNQPVAGQIEETVLTGIFFAVVMSFFSLLQYNFAIEVSENSIAIRRAFFDRVIRKGQVKTIVETRPRLLAPPGLRISQYGPLGTWFWGGIWIPKALPEYDEIRDLAVNWQQSVG